ncbi:MAG: Ig-like domain-containing protein [Chitinophagales bacterium]|nr:Ig-like domain-containing protein [Chitinophagales bacterium]
MKNFLKKNITTSPLTSFLFIMKLLFLFLAFSTFLSCKKKDTENPAANFQLSSIRVGTTPLNTSDGSFNINIPVDQLIVATFSEALDVSSLSNSIFLIAGNDTVPLAFSFLDADKTFSAKPNSNLNNKTTYLLQITDALQSAAGNSFPGIIISFTTINASLKIDSLIAGGKNLLVTSRVTDVDRNFSAIIKFNHALEPASLTPSSINVYKAGPSAPITWALSDSNKILTITGTSPLVHFEKYTLWLSNMIKGSGDEIFDGFSKDFYTAIDTTPKFPLLSDDDLLNTVEQQTFKYFWDFAHPTSGLARERDISGDLVTIGGSGFGVMAILVGIQRNFITRQEGIDRLEKIIDFLSAADRFHGAFPHWMDGNTGNVISFSPNDNGADLVETSYMMQGLLTVRQFLDANNSQENDLITKINALWNAVEWDWFTKNGEDVLYWHWSPDKGWVMNVQVRGYNEALITYFLAAASSTHTIDATVYHNGWAKNGGIINGKSFYGYTLPVGEDYGGPLFFAHYSFLGLNSNNLQDDYANYWTQNVNHSLINFSYCTDNPKNYFGYSNQCWGLTASDNPNGYGAQSPTNDVGTITPTAALSSFPYTPEQSMAALKFFYYTIGDKTWGDYGFYDAFDPTDGWYASSYLAIDEGPIIIMIENYRTQLLWNLFMSAPEVTTAMNKLGFTN